jgi:hypothetical protein
MFDVLKRWLPRRGRGRTDGMTPVGFRMQKNRVAPVDGRRDSALEVPSLFGKSVGQFEVEVVATRVGDVGLEA